MGLSASPTQASCGARLRCNGLGGRRARSSTCSSASPPGSRAPSRQRPPAFPMTTSPRALVWMGFRSQMGAPARRARPSCPSRGWWRRGAACRSPRCRSSTARTWSLASASTSARAAGASSSAANRPRSARRRGTGCGLAAAAAAQSSSRASLWTAPSSSPPEGATRRRRAAARLPFCGERCRAARSPQRCGCCSAPTCSGPRLDCWPLQQRLGQGRSLPGRWRQRGRPSGRRCCQRSPVPPRCRPRPPACPPSRATPPIRAVAAPPSGCGSCALRTATSRRGGERRPHRPGSSSVRASDPPASRGRCVSA
mmetsp:Transcript_19911/g.65843  ORF Transcript_19911/g.65843 Transcript_19911/m.65843 type:complete len:311 (-) Transcript_19911:134-1066(-)